MSPIVTIRPAQSDEMGVVLGFIRELAVYERLEGQCMASEAQLATALFGARPYAEVVFACLDGTPVGFALFFHNFSTFLGKPGLYLEDLFVRPAYRGRAIGKSLLSHLAALAVERDCGRFQWQVLDWNKPSRDFYERLGAQADAAWVNYRMTGDALRRLAQGGSS